MMKRREATAEEIEQTLIELPQWEVKDGKLHKLYKFDSFAAALGWMVSAGVEADKMDHHPEWSNIYNRVTVNLVTHDLGNVISTWDLELARKMDKLLP
ncbi:MAG: 4a-hydroxytetrahydrobiopterin dehydratase [Anaerolineales bacterium]|nr:4a-hydroxytetrahydrobiopterin dehydratase [Anaerolineales bacterium]